MDFLEPEVTHALREPVAFSGLDARRMLLGAIPLAHARREPLADLPGLGVELTFFRADGRLIHERVEARWSRNPLPQVRRQLEAEQRTLRSSAEPETIDVVARADGESAAFVHTADAMRGGRALRIDPSDYYVRVEVTGTPDVPVAWYQLRVPVIQGLELRGPARRPEWAPRGAAASGSAEPARRSAQAKRLPGRGLAAGAAV